MAEKKQELGKMGGCLVMFAVLIALNGFIQLFSYLSPSNNNSNNNSNRTTNTSHSEEIQIPNPSTDYINEVYDKAEEATKTPKNTQFITKDEIGADWAFKTNNGTLKCVYVEDSKLSETDKLSSIRPKELYFISNKTTYAVNGTAREQHPNYPVITEILSSKGNISSIFSLGLKLCD